jgi:hypothetical protein
MKIIATQTFLHGRHRFEKDKTYEVPPMEASHFVMLGWAAPSETSETTVPLQALSADAPTDTVLNVQGSEASQPAATLKVS